MLFHHLIRSLTVSRSEKGQDLAEYALLIGLIALVVVATLTALGANMAAVWNQMATVLRAALP